MKKILAYIKRKFSMRFLKFDRVYADNFRPLFTNLEKQVILQYVKYTSFAIIAILILAGSFVLISQPQTPQTAMIKSEIQEVKQTTKKPVAGLKDEKVAFTNVVDLKKIDENQKYLKLPKNAENVKLVSFKTKKEVNEYINEQRAKSNEQQLSLAQRQELVRISQKQNNFLYGTASLFDSMFASLAEAVKSDNANVVELPKEQERFVVAEYELGAPKIQEKSIKNGKVVVVSSEESYECRIQKGIEGQASLLDAVRTFFKKISFFAKSAGASLIGATDNIDQSMDMGGESVLVCPEVKNVLAHAVIPEIYNVGDEDKIRINWEGNEDKNVRITGFDLNKNGKIDYIEWEVPHLSTQTFEIIYISKAFLLDDNKKIIEDIHHKVVAVEGKYAEVKNGQFIEVTFEKELDNTKDITIEAVAKDENKPVRVEVYAEDSNKLLATFENIRQKSRYRILLTTLEIPTDTFLLKFLGDASVEYIVDPGAAYYWVGSNGSWSDASGHWVTTSGGSEFYNSPPTGSNDVFIDANSSAPYISVDVNASANNLSIEASGSVIGVGDNPLTVNGNLEVGATSSSGAISVSGLTLAGSGTICAIGSSIDYITINSEASYNNFDNCITAYQATNPFNDTLTVDGTLGGNISLPLNVYGTGTISANVETSNEININGDLLFSGYISLLAGNITNFGRTTVANMNIYDGGTWTQGGNSTLVYTGSSVIIDGTFIASSGGNTVRYSGAMSPIPSSSDRYNNLHLNTGITTIMGGSNDTFGGDFVIYSGTTFAPQGNTYSIGGTFTVNGTAKVDADLLSNNYQYGGISLNPGSIIDYSRNGWQAIANLNYYNLTTSNSGTRNLVGHTSVSNVATIGSGTTLITGGYTLTLSGTGTPFVRNGLLYTASGTIKYTGASANIAPGGYYNLNLTDATSNANDAIFTFNAGSMYSVLGNLTIDGYGANDRVNLVSSSPGTQWALSSANNFTIDFADVKDSNALAGFAPTYTNTVSSGNNINWNFTPVQSGHSPASSSIISDKTPTITFNLNINGDCRASTSDESYDNMSDNDDCTGDGTTSMSCTLSDLGADGSKTVYIACASTVGDKDTNLNNTSLTYTLDTTGPDNPTNLSWQETSPVRSTTLNATWTVSNSADLANQKIQFYTGSNCDTTSGSLIDLASTSTNTYEFTGSDLTTYTYKVTSIDNGTNETVSACSSAVSILLNVEPNVPVLVSPTNATYTNDTTPTLSANYSDNDAGDTGTTNYRISSSSLADCTANTNVIAWGDSGDDTLTNNENTTYTVSEAQKLSPDGTYYWCAQNDDGTATSSWTAMGSFILATGGPIPGQTIRPPTPQPIIPVPTETPENLIERVRNILNEIASQLRPSDFAGQAPIIYPPIEEAVPEEPQLPLQGIELFEINPLKNLTLEPIDNSISSLAKKVQQVGEALQEIGIDVDNPEDIKKLSQTNLYLPGLSEFAEMPNDLVFANTAGGLIDFTPLLAVDTLGNTQQKISTISGKPMQLIVKPSQPVESVSGIITYKSSLALENGEVKGAFAFAKMFLAALTDLNSSQLPKSSKQGGLLVQKFAYNETSPGIFTANILSPIESGKYDITTIISYKDKNLVMAESKLSATVESEGYVYRKTPEGKLRIQNAKISLYWINPENGKRELWPAEKFMQENPITTDDTGNYSFLVPQGNYYLEVSAKDYIGYASDIINITNNNGIALSIEMEKVTFSSKWLNWQVINTGIVIIVILLLIFLTIFFVKSKNKING